MGQLLKLPVIATAVVALAFVIMPVRYGIQMVERSLPTACEGIQAVG